MAARSAAPLREKRAGEKRAAQSSFALRLSISRFTRAAKSALGTEPSALSWPRTRTLTCPLSCSLSPTTRMKGTFCMACSRILAFIFSLRASTSTRAPIAFSSALTLLA